MEVTGEDDEAQTVSTAYSKEINPAAYHANVNASNYYEQFNGSVLSETITRTVTGADGNTISTTDTYIRGKNKTETVTTYETDDFGRTTKESTTNKKYQDGKWLPSHETEVLYTYDNNGNVIQTETRSRKEGESGWQTKTTKAEYDSQGRLTGEYTPRGVKEKAAAKYTYDISGRKIKEELPQEKQEGKICYQTISSEYDTAGNIIAREEQVQGNNTARTEYTYDKQNNLVMVKNCMENNKAQYVQYVYDTRGNKVRQFTGMTSPLTISVSLTDTASADEDTFTSTGKTYQLTVSGKKKTDDIRETRYEYDGKNQLVAYTDPEGRTETYTYDISGNHTKTVDKNGNTHKNTYDYQNRLTETAAKEKKTGKKTVHTYRYNKYGEVSAQDDTAFFYGDVSGQVTKETTKLSKHKDIVKNYSYDSVGNKTSLRITAGDETKLSLAYEYDGESKLSSVKDETGNEIAAYSYDADGNLSERTVAGNGMITTYAYDYQNRLTDLKNQTDRAGMISQYTSEYLVNGQKSEETSETVDKDGKKSQKTATYTYDLLGRITKETQTGREDISYTYDSNNNRKEMRAGNKITAYKYNKNDELIRTDTLNTNTEKDKVVIYKNDRNGNQLATVNRYEIPNDRKDRPYIDIDVTLGDNRLNENVVNHYNALNQLTKTLTKNYKVSFTYDAEGLRTSKTVNGEKTVFVWDDDQIVMELSAGGKVKKRYIRGNDLIFADRGAENVSGEASGKQYYVTDIHGNVVQLTDESGRVIKTYEYDSFGNETKPDRKDDNPFRYCGEYYDKETEEIYLRARYYQPEQGRFLTRDTYTGEEDEPLSLHLYTYCENDGVNMTDPTGHWGKEIHENLTKKIAEGMGFSKQDAYLIAKGCNGADHYEEKAADWKLKISNIPNYNKSITIVKKDYGSIMYQSLLKGSNHFKHSKPHLHTIDSKQYNKAKKMGKKIASKKKTKKRMALIGLWLHASQDRYAHGLESEKIKHMEKTDNYTYDYKGKLFRTRKKLFNPKFKKVSKWKENKRFKKTVEATEDYLKKVKKALNKRKPGTVKKAKNIDKIVTKFYSKQKVGSLSNDV